VGAGSIISMVAKSRVSGHEVVYDGKDWIYADTGEVVNLRPCSHCSEKPVAVMVKIPADLSHTGKVIWKYAQIDACIAPIVAALQKAGVDMRGSCCGHGNGEGNIQLQDGRSLIILSPKQAEDYYVKMRKKTGSHYFLATKDAIAHQ